MIDKAKGLEYVANMEELYLEVLQEFFDESEESIAAITAAYEAKDWPQYIILVHALKGTALTMGAVELSERAKAHEFAGKENRISDIEEDFEGLIQFYRENLKEIEGML